MLIEVNSKQQAGNALKMTTWVDVPIKVTPHRSLNSSKGVIRSRDLRDCDEAEVLDALRPEGVTHIKHITSKRGGAVYPTNTFILTFNKPCPPNVKAAYLSIPVETFVPNPLRYFNCQRFGHGKTNCNRTAICAKCGKEGHQDAECRESVHCCNCSGPHPVFSRAFPEWVRQRAIQEIRTQRGISFSEARQIYECPTQPSKRSGVSYASVCKQKHSTATQTDLTWLIDCSSQPL